MGRKSEYDELLAALGLDEPEAGDVTPQLRALVDRMRAEAARPIADTPTHISAAAVAAREAAASTQVARPAAAQRSRRSRFGEAIARVAGAVTMVTAAIIGVASSGVLDFENTVVEGLPQLSEIPTEAEIPRIVVTRDPENVSAPYYPLVAEIADRFSGIERVFANEIERSIQVVIDPTIFGGREEIILVAESIVAQLEAKVGLGVAIRVDASGQATEPNL